MVRPVAVVTGADRGLGLALADGLAREGWRVFAGRFLRDWPDLDDLMAQHPEAVTAVPLDVSCIDSLTAAAATIRQHTSHVDLLISNAGVNSASRTQNIRDGLDYAEMHRLYNINALGALRAVEGGAEHGGAPAAQSSASRQLLFPPLPPGLDPFLDRRHGTTVGKRRSGTGGGGHPGAGLFSG
ncbi:MAG: SDR family NAD(P)-dependent oxidoreductase [bacterium]|nr:SDR family NAD(P)-dependent oxidoreductase [bacterium]